MFAERTNWSSTPNRLSKLIYEKRARGEQIIDLTESNPTKCGFEYPKEQIISALTNETILSYNPEPRGLLSARIAISDYYKKKDVFVQPEQIFLTSSTSEAYSFLFKLLCNSNDEVLVPTPSYPLFDYLCLLNDVIPRNYHLLYDGTWQVDLESLETSITNRTKAIICVHPNNPTGSYIKADEFAKICSLAEKHHLSVIVDEVFEPYAFTSIENSAKILSSAENIPIFSLNGLSKLTGLPQLKLAWIIVGDNSERINEIINRLEIISDTFLSVNTPVQVALPKLLEVSPVTTTQILNRVKINYQSLKNIFDSSLVNVLNVEGGWYAILQLPQARSDENWAQDFISQLNIYVHPGYFFDFMQKSCVVISLLPKKEFFEEAILSIKKFVDNRSTF